MKIYRYIRAKGRVSVSEIVDMIRLKQPTVSYHLKEMERDGLLKGARAGRSVLYEINRLCPHYEVPCVLEDVSFPISARSVNAKSK